jgi:hypothetical protein
MTTRTPAPILIKETVPPRRIWGLCKSALFLNRKEEIEDGKVGGPRPPDTITLTV